MGSCKEDVILERELYLLSEKEMDKIENARCITCFQQEKREENLTLCLDVFKMRVINLSNILE
jgi:hypothetical protein